MYTKSKYRKDNNHIKYKIKKLWRAIIKKNKYAIKEIKKY